MKDNKKVSLKEFADTYNTKTNRRGHKMSEGYLYRLIRQHIKGERKDLWFSYVLEGEKDRIFVLI